MWEDRPGGRPQPRRHVHREHQAPVGGPGQRDPDQGTAESGDVDPALVQPGVEGAVSPTVLGCEGQVHERADRAVGAQQGIAQLEEGVPPGEKRRVQLGTERCHRPERVSLNLVLDLFHDAASMPRRPLLAGSASSPADTP